MVTLAFARLKRVTPRTIWYAAVDWSVRTSYLRLMRRRGLEVGAGCVFIGRPEVTLAASSLISIGESCLIVSRTAATALGLNHEVVLRTLRADAAIRIGARVRMSGTTICAARLVEIGERCVIGANVTIADTDFHALEREARASAGDADAAVVAPVRVGADVFIGGGSFILKGVTIGDGAIIGAGSIVTRDVGAGEIVAGNPARPVARVSTPVVAS